MKIRGSLAAGLGAFLLYALTGADSVQWQDAGQFVWRIGTGETGNPYGLALVHPLHVWLGRMAASLLPGNIPYALTLLSALSGAVAVGLLHHLVRRLARGESPAAFAAATLAVSHSFWRFSGIPEVYSLAAALLLLEATAYLHHPLNAPPRWPWVFAANGLALANHNLALLSLPVWGLLLLHDLRTRRVQPYILFLSGAAWAAGALPFLTLLAHAIAEGGDVHAVLSSALFGNHYARAATALLPNPGILLSSLAFLALSFPSLALPLALHGLPRAPRPLTALLLLHLLFVLRYNVIDQYSFLIPSHALLALLAGIGWERLSRPSWRWTAFAMLLLQPFLYLAAPALARASGVLERLDRHKPHRDDATYLLWPWSRWERSAQTLAREILDAAASEALVVLEDPMARFAVAWEHHLRGAPRAVRLLDPRDRAQQEEILRALSSASPPVLWIPARVAPTAPPGWQREGSLWRPLPGALPPPLPSPMAPLEEEEGTKRKAGEVGA